MMLDEFLTDGALVVVIAVMLFGLACWLYFTAAHRANHPITELDGLAEGGLARLDAECEYEVTARDPLRIQYRLDSADGKAMCGGTIIFNQLTFADWYRTGVHKTIREAVEADNPGWTIVGYHILPDNEEEACG